MTIQHSETRVIDPITAFVTERTGFDDRPMPLVALSINVTVQGGLALVETKRTYHNSEDRSIEALLTLPVPVQATFFGLTAEIEGRRLRGIAQGREAARETYEDAIEEGKAAVLHEEILRGVHSLSVANLAAGASVDVTVRWTEALRCNGNRGRLRIPMTVGDVYGFSKLSDADALVRGGAALRVPLRVRHNAGSILLAGTALVPSTDGSLTAEVPSDTPIDLQVDDWRPGLLQGRSREGKAVSLRIEPAGDGEEDLNVAVLVDHSGSMSAPCAAGQAGLESGHESVRRTLRHLARQMRPTDRLALWQFDHECEPVGTGRTVPPEELSGLVDDLEPPRGGTEIGAALDRVIKAEVAPDLLLITDGLSYELDVQRLAATGCRVFVVLVGEGSLEANVGHLAALTGGDVHCSFGTDVSTALQACLRGLRSKGGHPQAKGRAAPERVRAHRGNAAIEARWNGPAERAEPDAFSDAVAAFAAGLALGSLEERAAMRLAASEGLVTHLTSLVLVDEDGVRSRDLPITRKIKLPTPPTSSAGPVLASMAPSILPRRHAAQSVPRMPSAGRAGPDTDINFGGTALVAEVARSIDWNQHGSALASGVLDGIDPLTARFIQDHAQRPELRQAAETMGIDPLRLAIAWLAASIASDSRNAERVRRRLLRQVEPAVFKTFVAEFEPGGLVV